VTISGGKWTTYREMAADTIDEAARQAGLQPHSPATENLNIHGWHEHPEKFDELSAYGSDALHLRELMEERPSLDAPLDDRLPIRGGQVVRAVRHEMARTVEDVLARRTRCLLLDAEASIDIAPQVAELMADEMGRGQSWQKEQVETFTAMAEGYLIGQLTRSA
jgi:glycerol-3-phosphate dehydrogenase